MTKIITPLAAPPITEKLPLLVLMGFATPGVVDPQNLYRAQLLSADRLQYLRVLLNLMAVLFVWGFFYDESTLPLLGGWTVPALVMAILPLSASRQRIRDDYVGVNRHAIVAHGLAALAQCACWVLAMLLFGHDATSHQIIALWTLTSCLMLGAAVTFSALPLAAIAYLAPTAAAAVWMFYRGGWRSVAALVASYALVLLIAAIKYAREFGNRISASTELAEQSKVVSLLLREYEDNASDWLWQTDIARRVNGVSPRFATMLGLKPTDVEGKPLVQLLAGATWESGHFAPALHDLAERLKRHESFSNLAIPVEIDGAWRWWELSASPRMDEQGVFQGFRGVGSDVTAQREAAKKVSQLARFDPLTSLPNRLQLNEALASAIDGVEQWNSRCAFLMIDLDRFKTVNDALGHQIGDTLLEWVAEHLRNLCGASDICGRLGGDEFAIVIPELADMLYVDQLSVAIIERLSRPYEIDGHILHIGASVGSAVAPTDGKTTETLIRSADLALYRAKEEGGGKHCSYEPRLHVDAEKRRLLETALRDALEKDELHIVYQPVVNAITGGIEGFESLVRWVHPEMGVIPPAKFIPVAEDARLIAPIGEWVLRTACHEAMNWPSGVCLAINVSTEQLGNPHFVASVVSALAQSGLPAARLELEVTESVFLREGDGATQILEQLLGLGVRLSLDDFGTGYGSLGYLSRTKFSGIKIDRSFVVGAAKQEPESLAIIRAVVALANSLGMATTAEGVETQAELDMINQLGCTRVQGYYFGRPMPANEARALFDQGRTSAVA